MKKENDLVLVSAKPKKSSSRDSFGSFFGPSQPVVAKRVIEERRGMLDLHHITISGSKAASQKGNPQKQLPSRPTSAKRPKKRPADEYSDDEGSGGDYRSLIRQMFRYDPNRYRGLDEDDSDMEVDFRRIQAEERRSARIAKEEDERELAIIEEEERRERERKEAKRRKLMSSRR